MNRDTAEVKNIIQNGVKRAVKNGVKSGVESVRIRAPGVGDPPGAKIAQDTSRVEFGAAFLELLGFILAPSAKKRQDAPS